MPNIDSLATPQSAIPHEVLVEQRLDAMLAILRKMDARDKWRMVGSSVRSVISLIPIVIFAISTLYFYWYGEDLIKMIITETTQQTLEATSQGGNAALESILKNLPSNFSVKDIVPQR
jgi:hypothetical protein